MMVKRSRPSMRGVLSFIAGTAVAACAARSAPPAVPHAQPTMGGCELQNLAKMTSRHICPSGSNPAQMSAENLEGPVLQMDPAVGFVAVPAEATAGGHSKNWQRGTLRNFPEFAPEAQKEPSPTTFVMWTGGHCNGEDNLEDPAPFTRQGRADDWLVIKFAIPPDAAGRYQLWMRTSHRLKDGDNDVWAGLIGQEEPIKRAGFGPAGKFTWSKGPSAELDPGVHAFYVAGRSACMAVEQLAVAREGLAVPPARLR